MLLGSILYNKFFQLWEFRVTIALSSFINFFAGALGLLFVTNAHRILGFNDVVFYMVKAAFKDTLVLAFIDLPAMVLFAKITPPHIEGTGFAILTGALNLTNATLSLVMGSLLNNWLFGVTKANLESANMLYLVETETLLSLTPLIYLKLIPTRKAVLKVQQMFEEEQEKIMM